MNFWDFNKMSGYLVCEGCWLLGLWSLRLGDRGWSENNPKSWSFPQITPPQFWVRSHDHFLIGWITYTYTIGLALSPGGGPKELTSSVSHIYFYKSTNICLSIFVIWKLFYQMDLFTNLNTY